MFTLNEFVSRDNVPEMDRAFYRQLTAAFEADLQPVGALEVALAADMLRCTYFIRHYSSIDPAKLPDDASRHVLAIRHNAAVKSFRWSSGQLRKTQTDREIASRIGCYPRGIAGITEILKSTHSAPFSHHAAAHAATPASPQSSQPGAQPAPQPAAQPCSVAEMEALLHQEITDEEAMLLREHADLKKRTQIVPRNAPCPCGSGEKHKRCCGKDAPPAPGDWLRNLKNAA